LPGLPASKGFKDAASKRCSMAGEKGTLFFTQGNPLFEDCDAAILGVAFDGNASYGKGAAGAPQAIMAASRQMDIENPMTGVTLETGIHNFGIIRPKNAAEMIGETERIAKRALGAGKFFILLGGDHSIVNGLLKAVPKEACFVNFDAHLDLREEWQGKKDSHAAVAHRIFDSGFEQVWVGARGLINAEEMEFVSAQGLADKIFYCPSMPIAFYKSRAFPAWMKKENMLFGKNPDAKKVLGAIESEKVWLNIDIDCLGLEQGIETGVPTPFGLSLGALRDLIYEICQKKKVIGLSIAEVIPDKNGKSQAVAAMLCYQILLWLGEKQ
jgi:arginase family enzyme